MKRRLLVRPLLAALGAAALTAGITAGLAAGLVADAAAQQPVTLRYATFLPPGGIFTSDDGLMGRWIKAVEKDSGGLVKVEMLPGGTLGAAGRSPGAQLKMVTDGIADISFVIPSTTPGRFPDDNLFGLPVTNNGLEASLTFWNLHKQGLMRGYDDKQFYIVGLLVNPPNTLHSREPITRLEDVKGKRFQASGTEQQDLLRALGGTPVGTVTVRDTAEAISRGVVDGTPKDWLALWTFRISDAAFHHVDVPLGASTILFAMNRAKYDSLPAAARAAIDKHSGEAFVRAGGELFDAESKKALEQTRRDPKHKIVQLSKDEAARWSKAIEPVIADWRGSDKANEALWAAFQKTLAQVRADLAKPR